MDQEHLQAASQNEPTETRLPWVAPHVQVIRTSEAEAGNRNAADGNYSYS